MGLEQRAGQKLQNWIHETKDRRASLDFDWTAEELAQIRNRQIPERDKPALAKRWNRVVRRALIAASPFVVFFGIVWFSLLRLMTNRGDESFTGLYVLAVAFVLLSLGPLLTAMFQYSTRRKLSKKTVAAQIAGGRRIVQFGANQNRWWRFDREDIAALDHGRRYVVYSAGDRLIYLEEAAG